MKYIKHFLWSSAIFTIPVTNAFANVDKNSTAYKAGFILGRISLIIFLSLIIYKIYQYYKDR